MADRKALIDKDLLDLLRSALSNLGALALLILLAGAGLYFSAPDEVRIRRSGDPAWIAGFVVDDEIDREIQRLAALELADLLDDRPRALDAAEARIAAARDAAPDGPRRDALLQDLSLINQNVLLAYEQELRDRAFAVLGAGPNGFPEPTAFSPLEGPQTVDAVVDVTERDGALHFARSMEERADYSDFAASTFFGLTRAEMDAVVAGVETVGVVRRRSAIVGSVSGACSGHALREDADVYIMNVALGQVTGAGTVIGPSPPSGPFQSLGGAPCDISGGEAPREDFVLLARE